MSSSNKSWRDKVLEDFLEVGKITEGSFCRLKDQITLGNNPCNTPLCRERIFEKTTYKIAKIDKKNNASGTHKNHKLSHQSKKPSNSDNIDRNELIAEIDQNLRHLQSQRRYLEMSRENNGAQTWSDNLLSNSLPKHRANNNHRDPQDEQNVCAVLQKLFEKSCSRSDRRTEMLSPRHERSNRDEVAAVKKRRREKSRRSKNCFLNCRHTSDCSVLRLHCMNHSEFQEDFNKQPISSMYCHPEKYCQNKSTKACDMISISSVTDQSPPKCTPPPQPPCRPEADDTDESCKAGKSIHNKCYIRPSIWPRQTNYTLPKRQTCRSDSIEEDLCRLPYKPQTLLEEITNYSQIKKTKKLSPTPSCSKACTSKKVTSTRYSNPFKECTFSETTTKVHECYTDKKRSSDERKTWKLHVPTTKIDQQSQACQTEERERELSMNNLSPSVDMARRSLTITSPNVTCVDDTTYVCPDNDQNEIYQILPYATSTPQEPTSLGYSDCVADTAKSILEKSKVIVEDSLSQRSVRKFSSSPRSKMESIHEASIQTENTRKSTEKPECKRTSIASAHRSPHPPLQRTVAVRKYSNDTPIRRPEPSSVSKSPRSSQPTGAQPSPLRTSVTQAGLPVQRESISNEARSRPSSISQKKVESRRETQSDGLSPQRALPSQSQSINMRQSRTLAFESVIQNRSVFQTTASSPEGKPLSTSCQTSALLASRPSKPTTPLSEPELSYKNEFQQTSSPLVMSSHPSMESWQDQQVSPRQPSSIRQSNSPSSESPTPYKRVSLSTSPPMEWKPQSPPLQPAVLPSPRASQPTPSLLKPKVIYKHEFQQTSRLLLTSPHASTESWQDHQVSPGQPSSHTPSSESPIHVSLSTSLPSNSKAQSPSFQPTVLPSSRASQPTPSLLKPKVIYKNEFQQTSPLLLASSHASTESWQDQQVSPGQPSSMPQSHSPSSESPTPYKRVSLSSSPPSDSKPQSLPLQPSVLPSPRASPPTASLLEPKVIYKNEFQQIDSKPLMITSEGSIELAKLESKPESQSSGHRATLLQSEEAGSNGKVQSSLSKENQGLEEKKDIVQSQRQSEPKLASPISTPGSPRLSEQRELKHEPQVNAPRSPRSSKEGELKRECQASVPRSPRSSKEGEFKSECQASVPRSPRSSKEGELKREPQASVPRSPRSSKEGELKRECQMSAPHSPPSSKQGELKCELEANVTRSPRSSKQEELKREPEVIAPRSPRSSKQGKWKRESQLSAPRSPLSSKQGEWKHESQLSAPRSPRSSKQGEWKRESQLSAPRSPRSSKQGEWKRESQLSAPRSPRSSKQGELKHVPEVSATRSPRSSEQRMSESRPQAIAPSLIRPSDQSESKTNTLPSPRSSQQREPKRDRSSGQEKFATSTPLSSRSTDLRPCCMEWKPDSPQTSRIRHRSRSASPHWTSQDCISCSPRSSEEKTVKRASKGSTPRSSGEKCSKLTAQCALGAFKSTMSQEEMQRSLDAQLKFTLLTPPSPCSSFLHIPAIKCERTPQPRKPYSEPIVPSSPATEIERVSKSNLELSARGKQSKSDMQSSKSEKRSVSPKPKEEKATPSNVQPTVAKDDLLLSESQFVYIKEIDSEIQDFIKYLQNRLKNCDEMMQNKLKKLEEDRQNIRQNVGGKSTPVPKIEDVIGDDVTVDSSIMESEDEFLVRCKQMANLDEISELNLSLDSPGRSSTSDDQESTPCDCGCQDEPVSKRSEIPPFTGCECMREDYYKIMRLAYG